MHHIFAMPSDKKGIRKILIALRQSILWLKFYYHKLFCCTQINGSVALLHQSSNYYHFLAESMIALAQIQACGREVDYYILASNMPFQREAWRLLNIPESKIIAQKPHRLIKAKEIFVPTFIANVENVEYRDRILWARTLALPLFVRDFYVAFGERFGRQTQSLSQDSAQDSASKNPQDKVLPLKIFLTRPLDSNRNIQNLKEVESIFAHFGYAIIMPDSLSLSEQIILFHNAKVVASMHGAGLSNAFFMQENAIVFEIFPRYYHDPGAMLCAILMRCRYMYMVGDTNDTTPHPQQESAYIKPSILKKALQNIEKYC